MGIIEFSMDFSVLEWTILKRVKMLDLDFVRSRLYAFLNALSWRRILSCSNTGVCVDLKKTRRCFVPRLVPLHPIILRSLLYIFYREIFVDPLNTIPKDTKTRY